MLKATDKTIEITTAGFCPMRCTKYCPHELYSQNYKGCKYLTRESYHKMLSNTPLNTKIVFAGFSEPFLSKDCCDMIKDTYNSGRSVSLFTTLNGVTLEQMKDLCENVEFETVTIHLPDSEHNANIRVNQEYQDVFFYVIQNVHMVVLTLMNGFFQSNNRENRTRGFVKAVKPYPVKCDKLKQGIPVILPNGDAVLCCHDFPLQYPIGNLLTTPLDEILSGPAMRKIKRSNLIPFSSYSPCKKCIESMPAVPFPLPHKVKAFLNRKYSRQDGNSV